MPGAFSVSVGRVCLENPFILAPMAGISDPPFRRLCRRGGAALVCAEMVSANALYFGDEKSKSMLAVFSDEHPVSLQVFGSDPARLAAAAREAEEAGADIVDFNCGCPVPKITGGGAGMSLMEDEFLFARCLESMVKAVRVPVTVKIRLGFRRGENRAARFARVAESVGAAAVSVHARFQEDRHSGPPDLPGLRDAVAAVKIPVFGNGGVKNYADARRMMRETACAAVMIGQAAVGNPLIFQEFLREQSAFSKETGTRLEGRRERQARSFELLREHARMNADYFGEARGIKRLRKVLASYVRDLPRAAEFRSRACLVPTLNELFSLVDQYASVLCA